MPSKELQERYMQFQMLHQQAMKSQQQVQQISDQINELNVIKEGLEDISKTDLETELLVPISSGIFVKAKLIDNTKVHVNVGNNVTVKKSMNQADVLIKEQIVQLQDVQHKLTSDLSNMEMQLKVIEEQIMKEQKD
tara:strand:+ start:191 stop:598 length:408 start_codon:yes stop_codon:yes gene_type:complete